MTNCKKNETKKKERKKNGKKNCKEGRGKKPKIQACLNSQLLEKLIIEVKNKTKQNKRKQSKTSKKSYMFNNESPLIKTCTTSLF